MLAGAVGGLVSAGVLLGVRQLDNVLRATAGTVTDLAGRFGTATIAAHDFRVRTTLAFQGLGRDGERGLNQLKSLSAEMGVSFADSYGVIRKLATAGFDDTGIEQWYKRIQDAQWAGLKSSAVEGVADAVMRIQASGKFAGDEFGELKRSGISMETVWRTIAKEQGVSLEQLKKMKGEGKITAAAALAGLEAGLRQLTGGRAAGEYGKEMGAKTAAGFISMVGVVRESFFDNIAKAGRAPLEGMFSSLSGAAEGALAWMKGDDGRAFFSEIGGGIKTMAADIGAAFQSDTARAYLVDVKDLFLGAWRVGEGLWSVTKAFVEGFSGHKMDLEGTKSGLDGIAAFLKSEGASATMRRLGEATSFAAEVVIFLATNFRAAAAGAQGMVTATNKIIETVSALATSLYTGGATAAQSLVGGFTTGIFGGLGQVGAAAASMGQAALAGISGALDAHSPSRKSFKIGGWATEGLALGMVANDNARRAASTVAGDVRKEMAVGLGMNSGAAASPAPIVAGATTTHASTRSIGNITITINGNADQSTIDDLEARLVNLLERVA